MKTRRLKTFQITIVYRGDGREPMLCLQIDRMGPFDDVDYTTFLSAEDARELADELLKQAALCQTQR